MERRRGRKMRRKRKTRKDWK
jgi:hypothetical protein